MKDYFDKSTIGNKLKAFEIIDIQKSKFSNNAIWTLKCDLCGEEKSEMAYKICGGELIKCNCGNEYKCDNAEYSYELEPNTGKEIAATKLNNNNALTFKDKQRIRKIRQVIISRCYNENDSSYHLYGKNGIGVQSNWIEDIQEFINWAINSGYKPWLNLKRRNKDGDYTSDNCYWGYKDGEQSYNIHAVDLSNYENIGINIEEIKNSLSNYDISISELQQGLEALQAYAENGDINYEKSAKLLKNTIKKLLKSNKDILEVTNILKVYKYIQSKDSKEGLEDAISHLKKCAYHANKAIESLNK